MVRAVTATPRADKPFEVISDFKPAGDQPEAIRQLTERVNRAGATTNFGSGPE